MTRTQVITAMNRKYMPMRLLVVLMLLVAGCVTNKETGKSQWIVLEEDKEIELGKEAAPKFLEEYGGDIPSAPIREYVTDIGNRLAQSSARPELPWEFHVVDSSVINAFALPGGKVFISRALLEKMDNEAQLAGVLGHEVAHVNAKHVNDRMGQQVLVSGVLIGLGVAAQTSDEDWLKVLGVGAGVGGTVYLLSYNRDQEHESDRYGVKYMVKNGYNPMGQVQVMQILADARGGGGSGQPEFLSTHPYPKSRIAELKKLIKDKYAKTADDPAYGFYAERFNETVVANLKDLPPPKHKPKPKKKKDD